EERLGHRLAEQHFDAFASGCFEAQRERRAVSDLERVGTLLERAPRVLDVLLERVAAHLRTEEHLLERHGGGQREARRILLEERAELVLRRRLRIREVLRQVLHLLDQPPTHLVVVDVEAERERLAVEDLVTNRRLEQRFELGASRFAPVETLGCRSDALDDELGAHDPVGRLVIAAARRRDREERRAEHEKMEQWILEQLDEHDTPTPPGRAALSTAREAGYKAHWAHRPARANGRDRGARRMRRAPLRIRR